MASKLWPLLLCALVLLCIEPCRAESDVEADEEAEDCEDLTRKLRGLQALAALQEKELGELTKSLSGEKCAAGSGGKTAQAPKKATAAKRVVFKVSPYLGYVCKAKRKSLKKLKPSTQMDCEGLALKRSIPVVAYSVQLKTCYLHPTCEKLVRRVHGQFKVLYHPDFSLPAKPVADDDDDDDDDAEDDLTPDDSDDDSDDEEEDDDEEEESQDDQLKRFMAENPQFASIISDPTIMEKNPELEKDFNQKVKKYPRVMAYLQQG